MAENLFLGRTVVLVAEDEALVRMFTADFLVEAGYAVVEASNAAEALRELEDTAKIRVLVTDVEMPGDMDGRDVPEAERRGPDVVIIVTSGRVRPCSDDLAVGAEYFQKPIGEEAVVEVIRERLAT